jgi:hypothetical protein
MRLGVSGMWQQERGPGFVCQEPSSVQAPVFRNPFSSLEPSLRAADDFGQLEDRKKHEHDHPQRKVPSCRQSFAKPRVRMDTPGAGVVPRDKHTTDRLQDG